MPYMVLCTTRHHSFSFINIFNASFTASLGGDRWVLVDDPVFYIRLY
jgi:hypothetical protein